MIKEITSKRHKALQFILISSFFLSFFLLSLLFNPYSHGYTLQRLSFLCLNDFHAAVEPMQAKWMGEKKMIGGAACLAGYVRDFRKKDSNLLWVVAGDMFMGHYLDSLTEGKAMIEFLNMIPPDCFVLGNHEFDYGTDILRHRIDESRFPVICANIQTGNGEPFVRPYIIHEAEGIKVLMIGIICRNLSQIVSKERLRDIEVTDPVNAILKWTEALDGDVDLTVILSHSGLYEDRRIARMLPPESGVDIIIGGHSHDLMEATEVVNGIIICQAGSKGRCLGHLEVDVDPLENRVKSHQWELIPTICNMVKPHSDVKHWLAKSTKKMAKKMEEVIGHLEGEWSRNREEPEWAVGDFATDAIADEMGVEIGIYNRGGIRQSLTRSKIRVKDIWEIFPFGNYMVRFRLTGIQLRTLLEKHLTFRGEYLFFSRALRYSFNPARPAGDRLLSIEIQGKPIDPDRLYTLATVEFLWGHSDTSFGISQSDIKANGGFKACLDLIDRDIFIKNIRRIKKLKTQLDGRVKVFTGHVSYLIRYVF